ncbi:4-amino-4-deoxy-L-arabinose transferase [Nocardioides mangrovicus]|uniref:4-amino-4-deoxy-L-arabinose transferase n=1 Tax=Nocardioides mangrovicus TaxID=2478913 RepID=A0A3L8P5W6_9ACTN|nr:4-amino-4-deoxy-L-arabinose transferase [Nocardioides mangrovicus]
MLHHALARPARLGHARLICVDGPSGSGKSTLAAAIARRRAVHVVHVDEMFPGWDGMALIEHRVGLLLRGLVRGDGWWRRWDWPGDAWAEWHRVPAAGLVVLEGVGAGHRSWARWTTTLVWVEAPRAQRLVRGHERNHDMDEQWRRWQARENALFVAQHTRARADVVVPNRDN